MIKLNLETTCKEQEIIKEYLENNVSKELAEKINNGTPSEKDGKPLINKKTLKDFMEYACNEAKNLAEKNAKSACIEDTVVFGWAIHYFKENSIVGTLYNTDGSKYIPITKTPLPKKESSQPIKPKTKPQTQYTLFDFINSDNNTEEKEEKNNIEMTDKKISPIYIKNNELQEKYPEYAIIHRLGDFYEIFGNNAKIIGDKLELTITGRDVGLDERIPMIGFPYHVSNKYFEKILKIMPIIIKENNEIIVKEMNKQETKIDTATGEIIKENNTNEENNEFDTKLLLDISLLLKDKITLE